MGGTGVQGPAADPRSLSFAGGRQRARCPHRAVGDAPLRPGSVPDAALPRGCAQDPVLNAFRTQHHTCQSHPSASSRSPDWRNPPLDRPRTGDQRCRWSSSAVGDNLARPGNETVESESPVGPTFPQFPGYCSLVHIIFRLSAHAQTDWALPLLLS